MDIRLAQVYDASEYSRLRNSSSNSFFSKQQFTKEEVETWLKTLDSKTNIIYVSPSKNKDSLIGTVSLYNIDGISAEVGRIVIDPSCRGRGLGLKLVQHSINCARIQKLKTLYAYILEDNTASRRLFEKAGFLFKNTSNKKCYYELEL